MFDLNAFIKEIYGETAFIETQLRGGMMNESFVVSYNDKKYVLYIPTKQANEMVDRQLEKENHDIVYKLGLTSKNVYFDEETGIKSNRFIEGESLNHVTSFDVEKIANLLRTLHTSKKLSHSDYLPFSRIKQFIKERESLTKEVSPSYDGLWKVVSKNEEYLLNDPLVISHNDFQRSNIIKDLNDDYFMIDFEFMGNNSPIYDIACFGNDRVSDGEALLKAYKFNKPSYDDYRKFYLWRIFVSLQWYNVALIKHHRGEGEAHQINFLSVADHFIENAKEAYNNLTKIKR